MAILEVRKLFEGLNKANANTRVRASASIERWIVDTMNHHGVQLKGESIRGWNKCSGTDDKTYKRDAVASSGDSTLYAQIKFRQPNSGGDVGVALFQPFFGKAEIADLLRRGDRRTYAKRLARDFRFDGDVYACLTNTWDKLAILPYKEAVKPIFVRVIGEWLNERSILEFGQLNRTFVSKSFPEVQLKWKCDSGTGWDSGQEKVLCYIPMSLFESDPRAQLVDMIEAPEYVLSVGH